ncbi:MAG: DinB family protein [Micrococcales bacterium]|nr:DinB family protein [Micrococcales bacterium]
MAPHGSALDARHGQEGEVLLAFLAEHRRLLRETVLGLTDDEARLRLVPSMTTPMGLLKHAAFVETAWFVCLFGGKTRAEAGIPETADESFVLEPADSLEVLAATHEAATSRADEVISRLDLDARCTHPVLGELSLRWVLVHCIREMAQHTGHAEILAEQIRETRS